MILTLDRLWLNRTDTGEAISARSGDDRPTGYAVDGEVRTYAGGRRRAITTAGTKGSVQRTLEAIDLATADRLKGWLGLHVQMRDHRGQRWFGVFLSVDVREYKDPGLYSAAISLETTSADEGV